MPKCNTTPQRDALAFKEFRNHTDIIRLHRFWPAKMAARANNSQAGGFEIPSQRTNRLQTFPGQANHGDAYLARADTIRVCAEATSFAYLALSGGRKQKDMQ